MPRKKNPYERRDRLIEMEREFEERVEAQRKQSTSRGHPVAKYKTKTRSSAKAPLLLRVLAWCGVILLCIVVGYIGTDKMLQQITRPFSLDLDEPTNPPSPTDDTRLDMQKTTLSLFYPKDGVMTEEKADIIVRTREDNIQDAVTKLLALSGLFDETVYVTHVFRNVDTVYLNFSSPFISALNVAGARLSTLFITGIVRTMQDNFTPITRVRFLVDSKIVEDSAAPVDLAVPWQLR